MSADRPRDEALSRLYRESVREEPPAALDRRILEAARREVIAALPRRRPWYLRWGAQAGLAATVVLTVTVVLLTEREQGDLMPKRQAAPATDSATAPTPSSAPAPAPTPEREGFSPPVPAQARPATPAQALPAAGPIPAPRPEPAAELPTRREGNAADLSRSREGSEPAAAVPAAPAATAAGRIGEAAGERDAKVMGGAAAPVLNAAPSEAKKEMRSEERAAPLLQGPAKRSVGDRMDRDPAAWLEEIRRLLREGRAPEAREQLAAFRRAYPDHPVPEDLRLPQ